MTIELRAATHEDQGLLDRALYAAWQWRHAWDEAAFHDHTRSSPPDSYVTDFGRRVGDAGVIAEQQISSSRPFVGAAWYRLFSVDEPRPGFVSEDVPELVIAVVPAMRGRGVGHRLLHGLIDVADTGGFSALSLHVSRENVAAAALYRSMGFVEHRDHQGRGTVMVKQLDRSIQ